MPHSVYATEKQKQGNRVVAAGVSGLEHWRRCVLDWPGRESARGAGHVFRFDDSGQCGGASTVTSDDPWVSRGARASQQGHGVSA